MQSLDTVFDGADMLFRWDGWRALAAIGTFAAVWVALRRDSAVERREVIKDAHFIAAIIDRADSVSRLAKVLEDYKVSKAKVDIAFKLYDDFGLDDMISSMSDIKLRDCPTVEVMTTCGVILKCFKRIMRIYEHSKELHKNGEEISLSLASCISTLERCIKDLESELKAVSGRFYDWSHQDGHRKKVDEKINGTLRAKALRALPGLLLAVLTNRGPKSPESRISGSEHG